MGDVLAHEVNHVTGATVTGLQPLQGDADVEARLDGAIADLGQLPVLDRSIQRVRALAGDPDSSTNELVLALESDPNLAANLLRFANSAYAARPVRARTIRQAVTMVGRQSIVRLALEATVSRFFERMPGNGKASLGQMHVHAVQVGAIAACLAEMSGSDVQVAHLSGLLHDLGKLVLPVAFGEDVMESLVADAPNGPRRVAAERERLGTDHAWAGERFARVAGVDDETVACVGAHHGGRYGTWCPSREAACVQAAEAAVALLAGLEADGSLLDNALAVLGLNERELEDAAAAALPISQPLAGERDLGQRVAELEREARQDELTGVLNRRYWTAEARKVLGDNDAVIGIIDVDHFKEVNDELGHHAGDIVLSEVARIIGRHGVVGRLGGDEFALVIRRDGRAALKVAELILREVQNTFADEDRGTAPVSVSMGMACSSPAQQDLSLLMRAADEALYSAKQRGRGRVELAELAEAA
jgi:diguanylate cyclase (GGDEF)-like protein/putative nucleotidyltransferase with HDIG domain